jgi:hypothetical protein
VVLDSTKGAGLISRRPIIKRGALMKVQISRATVADGRRVVPGEVINLDANQAKTLINMGKALPVADAPKVENREKDVEKKTSKRRGRPPKEKE